MPPAHMLEPIPVRFEPSEELEQWARDTFIEEGSRLFNPDHAHLQSAAIGFLWTNEPNSRAMRTIQGQAEIMPPMAMGKWQRSRAEQQVAQWFGEVPDFLITLFAPTAAEMDDASFCALVEHELYHCGQERDIYGAPKFTKAGLPKFTMRGHDVEEFVGVVARYGARASGVEEMVEAARIGPTIAAADISAVCGNCLRAA